MKFLVYMYYNMIPFSLGDLSSSSGLILGHLLRLQRPVITVIHISGSVSSAPQSSTYFVSFPRRWPWTCFSFSVQLILNGFVCLCCGGSCQSKEVNSLILRKRTPRLKLRGMRDVTIYWDLPTKTISTFWGCQISSSLFVLVLTEDSWTLGLSIDLQETIRLEASAIITVGRRPSLVGWRPLLLVTRSY